MAGIVYFTTVTTAAGRDNLMKVAFAAVSSRQRFKPARLRLWLLAERASGLDKNSARSVAFEVGLQNGADGFMG